MLVHRFPDSIFFRLQGESVLVMAIDALPDPCAPEDQRADSSESCWDGGHGTGWASIILSVLHLS